MPYARRTYRRKRTRRVAFRPSRRTRKAAYTKRAPVRTRTATKINAAKIRRLQKRVIGHLQTGYHICRIPTLPQPGGFVWSPGQPLAICLNDFYSQTTGPNGGAGAIYYPRYFGAAPSIEMGASIVDRWSDYKPGENFGYMAKYWQWKDVENSQPSLSGYLPVSSDIRVCINREECTPAQGDMWVRLDIVKARRTFVPSTSIVDPHIYNMPTALGAFANMATPLYSVGRNRYNPALWSVKTRWFKLPAVRSNQSNLQKVFHIRSRFPHKFLKLNNTVVNGISEEFWNMVPATGPVWAIMSLSDNMVDADNTVPQINLTRVVKYRDSQGNGM